MFAQDVYKMVNMGAFSGEDAREFFTENVGEPSPKGNTLCGTAEFLKFLHGCSRRMRHNSYTSWAQVGEEIGALSPTYRAYWKAAIY
jgi:hypothetical protein